MKKLKKPKTKANDPVSGPFPLITTEEALFELLNDAYEKRKNILKNYKYPVLVDETQLLQLVEQLERAPEEDEAFLEAALERADYGATIDGMNIEQWLIMNYGRADDLIAARQIVNHLSQLGLPNSLMMERRDGRSYVESTQTFGRCFGVEVRVRLLQ